MNSKKISMNVEGLAVSWRNNRLKKSFQNL